MARMSPAAAARVHHLTACCGFTSDPSPIMYATPSAVWASRYPALAALVQ